MNETVIANTADITSSTPDPQPANNQSTISTTAIALADPGISKLGTPDPVIAGETVTYTLVYSNPGPSDAQGMVITDVLPAGVTFGGVQSETPAVLGPIVNGNIAVWTSGMLSAGTQGSIVFTVTVNADAPSVIINTVEISTTTTDLQSTNNQATVSTTVQFADVAIQKTVEPTRPVIAGETMTYTLAFSNTGNAPARTVLITDVVPDGLTWNGSFSDRRLCP